MAGLLGLGTVTNFLDTLGIGSFATTTAILRLCHLECLSCLDRVPCGPPGGVVSYVLGPCRGALSRAVIGRFGFPVAGLRPGYGGT